ncbi:hypothetical protein B0H10DRAFT_1125492 [Mycena sp. CBHHK59/15]|nr:hypothetical protein B0H10DRAFT_1125492 [Mycena sp. CBHHK59/15]
MPPERFAEDKRRMVRYVEHTKQMRICRRECPSALTRRVAWHPPAGCRAVHFHAEQNMAPLPPRRVRPAAAAGPEGLVEQGVGLAGRLGDGGGRAQWDSLEVRDLWLNVQLPMASPKLSTLLYDDSIFRLFPAPLSRKRSELIKLTCTRSFLCTQMQLCQDANVDRLFVQLQPNLATSKSGRPLTTNVPPNTFPDVHLGKRS